MAAAVSAASAAGVVVLVGGEHPAAGKIFQNTGGQYLNMFGKILNPNPAEPELNIHCGKG